jgi:FkbM family methyltransferase
MPTILWKLKSRIETVLSRGSMFTNLLQGLLKGLEGKDVFFVEIGANDGIVGDPLYPFIMRNKWKGVYIGPQKAMFERLKSNLKENRNVSFENIAITEKEDGDVCLYVPVDANVSHTSVFASLERNSAELVDLDSVGKEVVAGKPFTYIVDKYQLKSKPLVFVLMDVEGYEEKLIYSWNFADFSPKYLFFEHAHLTYNKHRKLNYYLMDKGYKIYVGDKDTLAFLA